MIICYVDDYMLFRKAASLQEVQGMFLEQN